MEKVMAVDLGTKRTGIAVSDPLGMLAQPLCVLEAGGQRKLLEQVRRLAQETSVSRFVVGVPKNMNGSEGHRAEFARRFAAELERVTGLPVETIDERLTTRAATSAMLEADASRASRRRHVDKIAAALILETWLARSRFLKSQEGQEP